VSAERVGSAGSRAAGDREECRGGDDVPHEDLVEHLADRGAAQKQIDHWIDKLLNSGDISERARVGLVDELFARDGLVDELFARDGLVDELFARDGLVDELFARDGRVYLAVERCSTELGLGRRHRGDGRPTITPRIVSLDDRQTRSGEC